MATNVAILHPNIFYFVIDASWSSYNSLEFWNKGNTDVTVNNNKIYKTIYSPSPADYAEPKTAAFIGFTTTRNNSWTASEFNVSGGFNKGWNFYCQLNFSGATIFFHALGYRATDADKTAYILGVNTCCCYWTAFSASNTTFRLLTSELNYVYPITLWDQCAGANIRSVLDL